MDVFEAIMNRRSIRQYSGERISDEQVERLLKAAMYAPSAVDKQPWHFIVFRNMETRKRIVEFHPNASMLTEADTVILVCYDENLQHDEGYGPVDCSAATQNILLAAHAMGLGAVWVGIYPRQNRIAATHRLFSLPENIKPFSMISLGYPAEKKFFPKRFKRERIHYEKW
ncbi:MAG: nitroreductase family protein [Bacteroidales bacterium]|nr:nitroreductase family protein [Bacteroidales bacterium]MBN2762130.1 nitroreductase family protein [Bacteroidales bacterium]